MVAKKNGMVLKPKGCWRSKVLLKAFSPSGTLSSDANKKAVFTPKESWALSSPFNAQNGQLRLTD